MVTSAHLILLGAPGEPSRGGPVNATSQYIQYGLALASTDPLTLPEVSDVTIARPMKRVDLYTGFGKRHITGRLHARYALGNDNWLRARRRSHAQVDQRNIVCRHFAANRLDRGAVERFNQPGRRHSRRRGLDGLLAHSFCYSQHVGVRRPGSLSGGYQNAGFSNDLNSTATVGISTQTGGGLYLDAGGTPTALSAGNVSKYTNSWHRYKIVWSAASASLYADNTYLGAVSYSATSSMKVAFGDQQLDGRNFAVDNVAVTPYNGVGTFTSRVLDAGQVQTWSTVNWDSIVAGAAAMSVRVRTGNTATPDGTWTAWSSVNNGSTIGAGTHYIQYQVTQTSTDPLSLPILQDITFNWALSFSPTFVRDTTTIDFYKGTLAGSTSINANYDGELTINGLPRTKL